MVELGGEEQRFAGSHAPGEARQHKLALKFGAAGEGVVIIIIRLQRNGTESDLAGGLQEFESLGERFLRIVGPLVPGAAKGDNGERPAGLQRMGGGADQGLDGVLACPALFVAQVGRDLLGDFGRGIGFLPLRVVGAFAFAEGPGDDVENDHDGGDDPDRPGQSHPEGVHHVAGPENDVVEEAELVAGLGIGRKNREGRRRSRRGLAVLALGARRWLGRQGGGMRQGIAGDELVRELAQFGRSCAAGHPQPLHGEEFLRHARAGIARGIDHDWHQKHDVVGQIERRPHRRRCRCNRHSILRMRNRYCQRLRE